MLPWSGENSEVTDEFIQKTVEILKNFIHETYNRDSKVVDFRSPEDVVKEMDFEVKDDGANLNELLNVSKKALDLSVKTGNYTFRIFMLIHIGTSLYHKEITMSVVS